jgi:hypothetical protein
LYSSTTTGGFEFYGCGGGDDFDTSKTGLKAVQVGATVTDSIAWFERRVKRTDSHNGFDGF